MKKVLFLGNIPTNNSKSIGGATVLAKNILNYLKNDENLKVHHYQLRTNWKKYGQILNYIKLLIKSPFLFSKYNIISFHATSDFHFTFAPLIWIWVKMLNKKIGYHFFGGIFYDYYQNKNKFHQYLIRNTILKSNFIFLETKDLIKKFESIGVKNCIWLPNARKPVLNKLPIKKFNKKFVFISRVTPTKGINQIVEVSKLLPIDYKIDIYGPLDDDVYTINYFRNKNVNYKGILNSKEVINTLKRYDVLLLPTYHDGEGYPGIIIESLSLGLPVITTKWKAIPEIITPFKNGLLIKPKDNFALKKAIEFINSNNYTNFVEKSYFSFENFNENLVFNKIVKCYKNNG